MHECEQVTAHTCDLALRCRRRPSVAPPHGLRALALQPFSPESVLVCNPAVVPNGVSTGLDIGLSNYSLMMITLSFYTMCKSTTPVFLLMFAFIWGIERCGCRA